MPIVPSPAITLYAVVAHVESGGGKSLYRFEPAVFSRYKAVDDQAPASVIAEQIRACEERHHCSPDSARVILASSWGRYQIMGFNIWNLGYTNDVWAYQSDRAGQDETFRVFVGRIGITDDMLADASWLLDDLRGRMFATQYNGPGQPDTYLASLRNAYTALSGAAS